MKIEKIDLVMVMSLLADLAAHNGPDETLIWAGQIADAILSDNVVRLHTVNFALAQRLVEMQEAADAEA